MFRNIPGFYSLNSSSTPTPLVTIKNASRHCQMSPLGKIAQVQNHQSVGQISSNRVASNYVICSLANTAYYTKLIFTTYFNLHLLMSETEDSYVYKPFLFLFNWIACYRFSFVLNSDLVLIHKNASY